MQQFNADYAGFAQQEIRQHYKINPACAVAAHVAGAELPFLETLTQRIHGQVKANYRLRERNERFMDVIAALPTNAKPSKIMEPGQRAFDNPTKYSQSTPVFPFAFRDDGRDSSFAEFMTMRFRVIGGVGLDLLRSVPWRSRLASNPRNVVYQRQEFPYVVDIGRGQNYDQRSSVRSED